MSSSNYGVVAFVQPPLLKSIDQPSLIRFETAYTAYLSKVEDVNKERPQSELIVPASIKDCIESTTLHALCILGEIDGASSVEEAAVDKVQSWFDQASTSSPKDISERIDSTLSSLNYNQNRDDPAGGVANFILNVIKTLDRNNASDVLKDSDLSKRFLDRLVHKFEPPVFRERIKMLRSGWKKEQLEDIKFFKNKVGALAVEIELNEVARMRLGPRQKQQGTSSKSISKETTIPTQKVHASNSKGEKKQQSDSRKRKITPFKPDCLNPDCPEKHFINECPNTTAEKRKELLEKYRASKKQKLAKAVKVVDKAVPTPISSEFPDAEENRFRVRLNDCIYDTALGDSGSDFNAISETMLDKITGTYPSAKVDTFSEPIQLEGAFVTALDNTFTASRSINLSITIYLPGPHIPIRIRGVQFLVVNQKMEETLLGRPFLKAIGFDLKEHLLTVKNSINGKHIQEIENQNHKLKLAATAYKGLTYMSAEDDPVELPECLSTSVGEDSKESIDTGFQKMLSETQSNNISSHGLERLNYMLEKYRNVFRIKLGPGPPASVPPLTITPAPNAKPYRSTQRRYAPAQRVFIENTVRQLENIGAIYKNPTAKWASPALAVPKPNSHDFRFTVDLRGPNSRTVPINSNMPHLDSELQAISGSTCFANIDFSNGYWQLPLSEESQEMLSIQTPLGVYSSRRLLQGGSDSGNHFQAVLADKFKHRIPKIIQWLDDFLLYGSSETELLDSLDQFFTICVEIGLKIHPEKSHLFVKQVKFCGRLISPSGIKYHPRHFSSLLEMKKPTIAADLQQFLCATNWMRQSIPEYARRVAPLHALLESVCSKQGRRTKAFLRKVSLIGSWGTVHDAAFSDIKKQLDNSIQLAHPKQGSHLCLFTDASESHWAAFLSQVPETDRNMTLENQRHEPLCFLSGAFTGASRNWSVPEKEGYAIVESMCRLDYLVLGKEVNIFTDHANLVYLYDPYGSNPGIHRHTASKLMRWAIRLSAFPYTVEHLSGDRNVWADMLTRWAVQTRQQGVHAVKVMKSQSVLYAPIDTNVEELDWPILEDIISAQKNTTEKVPHQFQSTKLGVRDIKNRLWIPFSDKKPQLRILVAAHTGQGGHRGSQVTHANVKNHFYWSNMQQNVTEFVTSCIHCLCYESGTVVPRPLGHALHAVQPNKLLHFDFCFMSKGENNFQYVLILKVDHSGYVWLTPTEDTTAETASEILIRWFSSFGIVPQWVSDRGSHFKNEIVRILRQNLKSEHHFTLAYCPWSNGTVEVVCRELLRTIRALLSESQLSHHSWPTVLPLVQSALNNCVLERLGNRCPLTAFTGLPQDTPLTNIVCQKDSKVEIKSIPDINIQRRENISRLQEALSAIHKDVAQRATSKRKFAIESHNRKTNVRRINFTEGEFVLQGSLKRDRKRKPSLKWYGPVRVVECRSDYIFLVEDLLSGSRSEVHGRRLKLFRNKDYEVTQDIADHLKYQKGELLVIKNFDGIRKNQDRTELLVAWKGFSDEESDWVDISTLKEDVPQLLNDYLDDLIKNGTKQERTLAASI